MFAHPTPHGVCLAWTQPSPDHLPLSPTGAVSYAVNLFRTAFIAHVHGCQVNLAGTIPGAPDRRITPLEAVALAVQMFSAAGEVATMDMAGEASPFDGVCVDRSYAALPEAPPAARTQKTRLRGGFVKIAWPDGDQGQMATLPPFQPEGDGTAQDVEADEPALVDADDDCA